MKTVSPRYRQRFCVHGHSVRNLISSVVLRAPTLVDAAPADGHHVVLDEVWTHRGHRGRGLVSGLLRLALESASRDGWAVYCRPVAHDGGPGPGQAQLELFYRRRGFEPTAAGWFVRPPNLLLYALSVSGPFRRAATRQRCCNWALRR